MYASECVHGERRTFQRERPRICQPRLGTGSSSTAASRGLCQALAAPHSPGSTESKDSATDSSRNVNSNRPLLKPAATMANHRSLLPISVMHELGCSESPTLNAFSRIRKAATSPLSTNKGVTQVHRHISEAYLQHL